jgi:hypothetical protein
MSQPAFSFLSVRVSTSSFYFVQCNKLFQEQCYSYFLGTSIILYQLASATLIN